MIGRLRISVGPVRGNYGLIVLCYVMSRSYLNHLVIIIIIIIYNPVYKIENMTRCNLLLINEYSLKMAFL
jgi:hypothetical protein